MNYQEKLDGQPSNEEWDGICCKACWFAKKEKCVCKCGGVHHGTGTRRNSGEDAFNKYYESAQLYKKLISDPHCHCGYDLLTESILAYPHSEGWQIEESKELHWLFIHCPKCDYDMSLWKIGVPRNVTLQEVKQLK